MVDGVASGAVAPQWRDETSACLRLCAGRDKARIIPGPAHFLSDRPWRFDGGESAE
jgi:hypothetical protein